LPAGAGFFFSDSITTAQNNDVVVVVSAMGDLLGFWYGKWITFAVRHLAKMVPAYIVYGVGSLLSLWIGLAVYVKRCHDRGKSGWWLLLMLIPFVGIIWWLVDLGILEGQQGANKYGPDPRAV